MDLDGPSRAIDSARSVSICFFLHIGGFRAIFDKIFAALFLSFFIREIPWRYSCFRTSATTLAVCLSDVEVFSFSESSRDLLVLRFGPFYSPVLEPVSTAWKASENRAEFLENFESPSCIRNAKTPNRILDGFEASLVG